MNNARVEKIARLPKAVRDVLGDRLEEGEKGAADGQQIGGRLARRLAWEMEEWKRAARGSITEVAAGWNAEIYPGIAGLYPGKSG